MTHWYQTRNDDYVTPVVRGMGRSKPHDSKRKRILDDDEIRALWKACDEMGTFGAILKCCVLTAQRRDKVTTMQWSDLRDGVWTIAAEPREKSTAGTLRLPKTVLEVINAQPRLAGNPHVFAVGTGQGVFNSFSQRKGELDEKLPKMPPWVIHDLRRTARSLMSRAGVRPDIAERVLGHAIPGVEGVYDRHHYGDEKADALKRLAHLVNTIVHPPEGNVVSMQKTDRSSRRGAHLSRVLEP
jgi:integrase